MADRKPLPPLVEKVLERTYPRHAKARTLLLHHGFQVAERALTVAQRVAHLGPDRDFLVEAALLHDVGMIQTDTPELGCTGLHPYILHGVLGRELLETQGLPAHALVAERHVGAGISAAEIRAQGLSLPERDMLPVTLEEEIICFADKFYSKVLQDAPEPSLEQILRSLGRHGPAQVERFRALWQKFSADQPK